MARQRPDERGHQRHVHHRDVIHDQQVAREWIGLTTLKPPLPGSASSKRWMVLASNSGLLPIALVRAITCFHGLSLTVGEIRSLTAQTPLSRFNTRSRNPPNNRCERYCRS